MSGWMQDVRYALRQLLRSLGFALTAVAALLASDLPARRAASIEPTEALRAE